jgi:deoxyguanosine kinase
MLICIEGCLGVGKSSLVQRFAQQLPCIPFYEEVSANPFLLDFYHNPKQYALHVQYTFLLLQERQFRAALTRAGGNVVPMTRKKDSTFIPATSQASVICDFHPFKSQIFASVVLPAETRGPLMQLYRHLRIPQPDLIIYLKADEHTILARLRKRQDGYQEAIDLAYVTRVCSAYENFFRTYTGPVVTIDTTYIDYVSNPEEVSVLLQQIPLLFTSSPQVQGGQAQDSSPV